MNSLFTRCVAALLITSTGFAAESSLRALPDRVAADADTPIDFQRHMVPLMGKLGCNGRACHGSFQGQGDFRLSLFGYDFGMDREGLLERVDVDDPADSYAVQKALGLEDHGGGQRFTPGSWQHKAFLSWIAGGAAGVPSDEEGGPAVLDRLEVSPSEIVFSANESTVPLKVIAVWDDGSREDVTPLARYRSNDDQVAEITETGLVTSVEPGDTHVVVFYDNGVLPIPVMRPRPSVAGLDYGYTDYSGPVDLLVADKLRKINVAPSDLANDITFLRRVSLDIAGTLPTPTEVQNFALDTAPDKRERKIEELLNTPAYAAWWATWLCDVTGNSEKFQNNLPGGRTRSAELWYSWIYDRVERNVPYDEIVRGIVLADSRLPGEDYAAYCVRTSSYVESGSMADAPGLVQYWSRSNFRKPEERAIGFAYTFLGLRIQCAQCHKHPFDEWTQDDFEGFQAFFGDVRFGPNPLAKKEEKSMLARLGVKEGLKGNQLRRELDKLAGKGKAVPQRELYLVSELREAQRAKAAKKRKRAYVPAGRSARVLGGDDLKLLATEDPREPLMNWLSGDARDLFAKAVVNRIWGHYFGRGIVHPTDDMSLANPPSNAALLDHLAAGFIASGFDLKWVHREICNSRTYQSDWRPNESNRLEEKNFARSLIRRLPAEVAIDAVAMATADDKSAQEFASDLDGRQIAKAGTGVNPQRGGNYALTIFGKNLREANCDCERSNDPSLLQTIFLRNDLEVLGGIDRVEEGWLPQVAREWNVSYRTSIKVPSVKYRPTGYEKQVAYFKKLIAEHKERGRDSAVSKVKSQLKRYERRFGKLPVDPYATPRTTDGPAKVTESQAAAAVEEAYLRTVSRPPTDDEQATATEAILAADDAVDGLRDVVWSLINTKEFQVNH